MDIHKFKDIRNVAVIAHVDHGKTTLIDAILKQTHLFRENQEEMGQERILDRNDLERERGITILAKVCATFYKDTKINIIDTPGHADFSGEVERTLSMADGALLIVDAQEGPMPQTRFVLKKAFELNLPLIVVINKIDKQLARTKETHARIETLFLELATTDHQLNFPVLYAVGRLGKVFLTPKSADEPGDVTPLLETIINTIPTPKVTPDTKFKMLISSIDYDTHLGRIAIGKILQGPLLSGQKTHIIQISNSNYTIENFFTFAGLERIEATEATTGDIVAIPGIADATIGSTLADPTIKDALTAQSIGEPTLHLTLGANTSPLAGREGQFVTSREISARLTKELESNLSLHVEKTESGQFQVSGRGILHLAILFETMRREGYEFEVGKPEVITKKIDGETVEPVEELSVIVPQNYQGAVTQEVGVRNGQLQNLVTLSTNEIEFTYHIPTRNLIGLRNVLLTKTKGTVVFNSQNIGFVKLGSPLPKLRTGALIAAETGKALAYGINAAQERGITFIVPGTDVYEGMIIGQSSREQDVTINVCKGKKLTNMRSKSSDGIIQVSPPVIMSLEQSLEFLEDDELLEITPTLLRPRKKSLTELDRRRSRRSD